MHRQWHTAMAVRRTPAQSRHAQCRLDGTGPLAEERLGHKERPTLNDAPHDTSGCGVVPPGGTAPQLCCVALPDTHRQFRECTNARSGPTLSRAGSSPIPTALSSLLPRPQLVPAQPIAAQLPAATGGSVQLIYAAVVAIRSRCTVGLEIGARNPSRYVKSGKEATTAHPFPRISCSRRSYPTGLLRVTVRGYTSRSTIQTSAALTAPADVAHQARTQRPATTVGVRRFGRCRSEVSNAGSL